MNEPTMETLVRRLDRVERHAKWAIGVSILLAVVVTGQTVKGQPETLQVKEIKAESIRATSVYTESTSAQFFFVTDGTPKGVFRAKLMVSAEDSPALTFYDRTGRERLVLGLYRDEPNLTLYDAENGKVIWSAP